MSILDGLNPQQSAAVAHRHGPAVVIAGPGAGKTRVLTARSAALLQEGVKPERILLLTFTRAAANTMMARARSADERAEFLTAGTFHSWGIRIINANAHVFGLEKEFTMLDQDDVAELVKRAMEPLKGGEKNWPRASTVAKMISYSTNTRMPIAEVIERRYPDYAELADEIGEVRDALVEMKIEKGLIDYDDVLTYLAMLLEDDEIGQKIREQYDYVMVDEYQDTNELQLQIVHGLVGDNGNVMIVGDPSQSIYGFRGGAPATMTRFRESYPGTRILPLEINYRSTPEIIELVNAIDGRMDIGFDRTLKAGRSSGKRPVIVDVTDNSAEAAAIADAILADKANGGEISDHAVLVRSTPSARRIETEFISRNIPHTVKGGVRIDEAAHIKDLLSIGRISVNIGHEPAWLRMLSRFRKIGAKAAESIAARTMTAFTLDEACSILREEGEKRKTELATLAEAIEAVAANQLVAEGLEAAMAVMRPVWASIWDEDWSSRERDLEAVLLIAEEHPTMEGFLTTITLDASMDRDRTGQREKTEEDPVTISTIHSAKGLEWKHVHIPAFVQGGLPSLFAQNEDDHAEELRIAYVAVSRAEKTLSLYRPRFNGQGNFTSPSEYDVLFKPYVDQEARARKVQESSGGRVETSKKIDLKSRMLGRS